MIRECDPDDVHTGGAPVVSVGKPATWRRGSSLSELLGRISDCREVKTFGNQRNAKQTGAMVNGGWRTQVRQTLATHCQYVLAAEAARITLTSRGAKTAGVDGIVGKAMKENLQDHLKEISAELLAGTYEPLPAKRVYIPKANGKSQAAGHTKSPGSDSATGYADGNGTHLESDFHRLSYGFRPGVVCIMRYEQLNFSYRTVIVKVR